MSRNRTVNRLYPQFVIRLLNPAGQANNNGPK